MNEFYSQNNWDDWQRKESKNYNQYSISGKTRISYRKKGYLHFDHRFPFPQRYEEIRQIVSNPLIVAKWEFYPFLKVINQTHRFRYDPNKKQAVRSIKDRPICYAAHKDALIYGFYAYCLTKRYEIYIKEAGFADSVLAYRTDLDGKCNIQFAREAFKYIKQSGECTVIALDITSFFDRLNHQILKRNWLKVTGDDSLPDDQYKIFKTLTRFAYVKENNLLDFLGVNLEKLDKKPKTLLELSSEEKVFMLFQKLRDGFILRVNGSDENKASEPRGIPQGSPMSAVLSNIYMIDFDNKMYGIAKANKCIYFRYCDDILFICPPDIAQEIRDTACEEIRNYKLDIQAGKEEEIWFRYDSKGVLRAFNGRKIGKNQEKFSIEREHRFYKSLQYLGFEYNGQDIRVRSSSLNRFDRKTKRRIDKSVKMAYSRNGVGDKVKTRTTYLRYSHVGRRNFPKYIYDSSSDQYPNASGQMKDGMDSPVIRRQIAKHVSKIQKTLSLKNQERYAMKTSKGIPVTLKRI